MNFVLAITVNDMFAFDGYLDIFSAREFWRQIEYAPDGKRGFYARSSQRKRRKKRVIGINCGI